MNLNTVISDLNLLSELLRGDRLGSILAHAARRITCKNIRQWEQQLEGELLYYQSFSEADLWREANISNPFREQLAALQLALSSIEKVIKEERAETELDQEEEMEGQPFREGETPCQCSFCSNKRMDQIFGDDDLPF